MAVTSRGWRRSRRKFSTRRALRILRNPAMLRLIAGILIVLLIVRVASAGYAFRFDSSGYAGVGLGNSRQDVLYGIGQPAETADASGAWRPFRTTAELAANGWAYQDSGGGRVDVRFDERDGKVGSVSCTQSEAIPSACGHLYGIGLGDSEDRLSFKLGRPTAERLATGVKIVRYDDLGVEFTLKQYTVYKIKALRERGGAFARTLRFVRSLVP